jgi:lauroyl/myristoyl acyltransferase
MRINLSSFLQWRFNVFLCQLMGWKTTFYYINFLGKVYFFLNRKEKLKITNAIQAVFSDLKPQSEVRAITRGVFRGISSHYYEKFFNAFSSAETLNSFLESHMEFEGMVAINKGLAKGNGVLLITGHFGGVELIPALLGANNYPATIIAKFSSNSLRQISMQQADNFSVRIIDADRTNNLIKTVFEDLRENRIVITQCDEIDEWKPFRNHGVLFLGKPVQLDRTISIITKRCSATVVFGVMHRVLQGRYKFIVTSWEEMAHRFRRSADMPSGAVVLKFMEQYIYKYPEGWYQWKKYPALDIFALPDFEVEVTAAFPTLEPSFQ